MDNQNMTYPELRDLFVDHCYLKENSDESDV
mgnify:FL=1